MINFTIPEEGIKLKILENMGVVFTRHGKANYVQTNIGPNGLIFIKIHRADWDIFDKPKYCWYLDEERVQDLAVIALLDNAYNLEMENPSNWQLSDIGLLREFFDCNVGKILLNKPFEDLKDLDLQKLRRSPLYSTFVRKHHLTKTPKHQVG